MRTFGPVVSLAAVVVVGLGVAACATSGSAPGSPVATPTPVTTAVPIPVSSPEDAAARVIASDPRFKGATMLLPHSIGLTKWWEWKALDSGGYEIKVTMGWGDCPAGCIDHHTWEFDVAEDGTLTPMGETGDPVPPGTS
jgi:hypothetical protein